MKITPEMLNGMREFTKNRGGQAELARLSGISRDNISRYLSGYTKEIRLESWQKLYPVLKPYLKEAKAPSEDVELLRAKWEAKLGNLNLTMLHIKRKIEHFETLLGRSVDLHPSSAAQASPAAQKKSKES